MSEEPIVASQGMTRDVHPTAGVMTRMPGTDHAGPGGYVVGGRKRGNPAATQQFTVEVADAPPVVIQGRGGDPIEDLPQPSGRLPPPGSEQPRPPASTLIADERPNIRAQVEAELARLKPAPRVKVVLRGTTFGKSTLFCSGVAISDSLVVIQYPDDGQTTLVEPPVCGADDPLLVTYEGLTYRCLSGEWAVQMNGQYLVVLIRLADPDEPVA